MSQRRKTPKRAARIVRTAGVDLGLGRQFPPVQQKIDAGDLDGAREALFQVNVPVARRWFEGKIEEVQGNHIRAKVSFSEGLKIACGIGGGDGQHWSAHFRFKLALIAWQRLARKDFEENLGELRRLEDLQKEPECFSADSLTLQALMNESQWRNGAAALLHEQVRMFAVDQKDRRRELYSLMFCGRATRYVGDGHQAYAHEKLMSALSLATELGLKKAELRTRMLLADMDDASVDMEDATGKKKLASRYEALRDEAKRYGFGALVMRFDERLMRRSTATMAGWARVIEVFKSNGYDRLALLHLAHSLRYMSVGERDAAIAGLEELVMRVGTLTHPEDGSLIVRNAAESIAHLAGRGISLGVSEERVAQHLRDLREACVETTPVNKLHLERQGALVRKLLEALTPESPRSKLELALGRGYAKLPTFDILRNLQRKQPGDFVTISEIVSSMSASRPGIQTLTESTVYKRVRRIAAALIKSGSPFKIETRKGSGVRIVGPGLIT